MAKYGTASYGHVDRGPWTHAWICMYSMRTYREVVVVEGHGAVLCLVGVVAHVKVAHVTDALATREHCLDAVALRVRRNIFEKARRVGCGRVCGGDVDRLARKE